jgi:hypothetical protein
MGDEIRPRLNTEGKSLPVLGEEHIPLAPPLEEAT